MNKEGAVTFTSQVFISCLAMFPLSVPNVLTAFKSCIIHISVLFLKG